MISEALNQKATLWKSEGIDAFGNPDWSGHIHLMVRWEDKKEVVKDDEGNEITSNAIIYAKQKGDYQQRWAKGHIEETDPTEVDSREVITYGDMVDLESENQGYKVWL